MDDKLAFMGARVKKLEKHVKNIDKHLSNLEVDQDDLISEVKSIRRQLNQVITEDQYEIIEKRVFKLEQAVGLAG